MEIVAPASSQEVSGLLIALAGGTGPRVLDVRGAVPSRSYVDLTASVLAELGVAVAVRGTNHGERFEVAGPLSAPAAPLEIEPDASLAAVVLAAGCLSGGEVAVPGIERGSAQPDVRVANYLFRFGARTRFERGRLVAHGRPVRGAHVDLSSEPDLAPVLAAVAAGASGRTTLVGLGTLPGKESSRIEVLGRGLAQVGCTVEAAGDSLSIEGPAAPGGRVVLDPAGDHRMAFAFALIGLVRDGVDVADPGCVKKSWPSFWEDMERLRGTES
jgi:3-phosphoshikimate 1-carboxyvinyltransferase